MRTHIFLLLAIFFCACSSENEPASLPQYSPNPETLVFTGKALKNARIGVSAVLLASKETGLMELRLNIKNYLEVPAKVEYLQAQLATLGGARATAEYSDAFSSQVEPGEEMSYVLKYNTPIHSKHFFHLLEYRGDLNNQYVLNLEFLGFPKQNLTFDANPVDFAEYQEIYGKEKKIRLFEIANHTEWESQNKACFKQKAPKVNNHSVSWRNGEWMLGGVVGRTTIYQLADSLYFSFRVVNQSDMNINIQPDLVNVETLSGETLKVVQKKLVLTTRKNPKGAGFVIQKGERFQVDFVYIASNSSNALIVNDLGVRKLPELIQLPCFPFQSAQSGVGVVGSNSSSM